MVGHPSALFVPAFSPCFGTSCTASSGHCLHDSGCNTCISRCHEHQLGLTCEHMTFASQTKKPFRCRKPEPFGLGLLRNFNWRHCTHRQCMVSLALVLHTGAGSGLKRRSLPSPRTCEQGVCWT